ncbi:MAG: STAS-like domain-containing protein, partial [Candidatus Berkelbacteria bacterium]|nr:STAS-like domain-containing protein [Candidatus Berkelbacteria bacterium]
KIKYPTKGTKVSFNISLTSKKHLIDLFKHFQSDLGDFAFDITEIQVKLFTMGTIHISRSQARRILSGMEKFETIILDFDRVPIVGQAFADEIFRVFQNKHPKIKIVTKNMSESVEFMVERARISK